MMILIPFNSELLTSHVPLLHSVYRVPIWQLIRPKGWEHHI